MIIESLMLFLKLIGDKTPSRLYQEEKKLSTNQLVMTMLCRLSLVMYLVTPLALFFLDAMSTERVKVMTSVGACQTFPKTVLLTLARILTSVSPALTTNLG